MGINCLMPLGTTFFAVSVCRMKTKQGQRHKNINIFNI